MEKKGEDKTTKYFFDKRIFRFSIVLLLLLFCVVLIAEGGFTTKFSYSCPASARGGICQNIFYKDCSLDAFKTCASSSFKLPSQYEYIREYEFVPAGFFVGEKKSFIYQSFPVFVAIIILSAFVVNHFLNNRKFDWKAFKKDLVEKLNEGEQGK